MYSKKVMELFQKPHNMGELPDADGVGMVGNPVCLPPDEMVIANPEPKRIDSVKIGEKVLGHDGKFHAITLVASRPLVGRLVRIKNCFGEMRLTPEHKVLAVRIPKKHHYAYFKNKKKLPVEWIESRLLTKGDLCVYPSVKKTRNVLEIDTRIKHKKFDYKSVGIPARIPVNADFLRLSGYFLSEGNLKDATCRVRADFTFSLKENDLAEDVIRIVKQVFGLRAKKKMIASRNTIQIIINNVHFVRFFKQLFGNGAAKKSIPEFMMTLPPEKQKALLKGLWLGGGFLNKRIPRAGYSTISRKLAEQVKTLLLRQGITCSSRRENKKNAGDVHHCESYRIHVSREGAEKIAELLGEKLSVNKITRVDSWFEGGNIFTPITEIASEPYEGLVYDISVEDTHSFVTPVLALHNCGDLMHIYIKVKNDKIEDIKFSTFGCVAAIATSSMITDLAKGKTIEEALKITRQNVADGLGGLPPIKMHCSNLAADGLHEAIYDYLKKNKREIPPELEKEHERIKKHDKEEYQEHVH